MSNEGKDYDNEVKQYQKDLYDDWVRDNTEVKERWNLPEESFSDWLMNRLWHAGVPAKIDDDPNQWQGGYENEHFKGRKK